jgi:hypothetical protein
MRQAASDRVWGPQAVAQRGLEAIVEFPYQITRLAIGNQGKLPCDTVESCVDFLAASSQPARGDLAFISQAELRPIGGTTASGVAGVGPQTGGQGGQTRRLPWNSL